MENKETNGLKWDNNYLLGNDLVDAEHRQLFDLVNGLVRSCNDDQSALELGKELDFLANYTVQHFADEENLQIISNYPEYKTHKKLHEDFKLVVTDLVKRFNTTGSSTELSNDVKRIVVRWLINHILMEDKKIGVHLRTCG